MDKIIEVSEIEDFLAGPLVTWFASCLEQMTDERVTYDNLVNGYHMHNVFLQMNLQVHDTNVYPSTVDSAAWRSRNLVAVLANLRHFYEDALGQVILRPPDVDKLGREPEHHVREIEIMLELLLGCAVQCPKRERFIGAIERLDIAVQRVLAECISRVIDVPGIVLSADMLTDHALEAVDCVRRVCREREDCEAQLRRRRDEDERQLGEDLCERAGLAYRVASLEEELRARSDELEDARAELREREKKLREVEEIREKLVLEAKNVEIYRDELDEAKAAVERAERLEQELARCRKKLADLDACTARLKQLERSNQDLTIGKAVLERSAGLQKSEREATRDLKGQLTKLQEQLSNLTVENAENRDKYWTAREENKELQRLVREYNKQRHEGIPSVKDDLLLNHANSQLTKLQADNKSLESYVETLKQSLFDEADKVAALKGENKKLSESYNREARRSQSLQAICDKFNKLREQGLENIQSLLEITEKRTGGKENGATMQKKASEASGRSFGQPKDQKYNVARSRKHLKYVKSQS